MPKDCWRAYPLVADFASHRYIQTAEEFASQMLDNDPAFAQDLTEHITAAHAEKSTGAWVSNPKAVFLGQLKR